MKLVIKYGAILMAVVLSATIIGSCVSLAVELGRAISGKSNGSTIIINGGVIWDGNEEVISEENGVVEIFGIRLNGSGEVKSGSFTECDPAEIHSLNVESSYVELVIEEGMEFSVVYENIPEDYVIEVSGGTLNITRKPVLFQVGPLITKKAIIRVTVPEGKVFEKVEIDNGSGSVRVSCLETGVLVVDSGSGAVTIQEARAENSTFDMGSGSLRIENSEIGESRLDTGSGAAIFDYVTASNVVAESGSGRISYVGILTGNCVFDTGSGSVNLELTGAETDYNIRADLGSGGLYINGNRSDEENIKYNNASNLLVFDTGSGRVSVKFSEPVQSRR